MKRLLITMCCLLGSHLTPAAELPLFVQEVAPGWQLRIADLEGHIVLNDAAVQVPKVAQSQAPASQVGASLVPGPTPGSRAIQLHWAEAWQAALRIEGGTALDLRPFLDKGTLEFDLQVEDMARGGLHLAMNCGPGCGRKLNLVLASRGWVGRGWQHMAFPLSCFKRDEDNWQAVTHPFALESSGFGRVQVANIRLRAQGQANQSCPDYRSESVTPQPLNQVWSLDWWMDRHQQKLREARQRLAAGQGPQLLFIGDSITQGWEDVGRPVWARYLAPLGAMGLGFGGDKTENVLWRLQHGEVDGLAPKVVVLMIGTNNTGDRMEAASSTVAGIQRLLDELRQRLPRSRVLLLALFPRGERPDDLTRLRNEAINALLPALADGQRVVFHNLNAALMNADGSVSREVMPDLLHLSELGYRRWAEQLQAPLQRLLAAPPLSP